MNEKENADLGLPQASDLRHEAERRLHTRKASPAEAVAKGDARALVHELQVHQIELEMQNEELQRAGQRPRRHRRSMATCSTLPRLGISCGMPRGTFWRSTWLGPRYWAWTETPWSRSGSGNS